MAEFVLSLCLFIVVSSVIYFECWNALICIFLRFCHSKEILCTLQFMGDEMSLFSKEKLSIENSLLWCTICFVSLYYITHDIQLLTSWKGKLKHSWVCWAYVWYGVQFASKARVHNTAYVENLRVQKMQKSR